MQGHVARIRQSSYAEDVLADLGLHIEMVVDVAHVFPPKECCAVTNHGLLERISVAGLGMYW